MPNPQAPTTARPVRGAARNRGLEQSRQALLPDLDPGITLLDIDGDRGVPVLQSLVLDRLLTRGGPAFWVDAQGHATTAGLAQLAPSRRLLDRIHVARGFTAYQHYSAVRDLQGAVERHVRDGATRDPFEQRDAAPESDGDSSLTPSLVVAPAIDAMYRADDALPEDRASTLQARCLATLARYAEGYDVPVLVTRQRDDAFTTPVETRADRVLRCVRTDMGPRFVGDGFETLVYPVDDGSHYQTTLAYWHEILARRARQAGLSPAGPDSTAGGEPTVGDAAGPDPVADALAGLGGR